MKIIRVPAPGGWTQVPNAALRDERLSYRARGLHAYLLSHSDAYWNETAETLSSKSPDGRDACRSGLRELARHGYVEYRKSQTERGTWTTELIVYSVPKDVSTGHTENGFPASGATCENDANPQVTPETENPLSVTPNRERETRSRSDQGKHPVPAGRTGSGKPAPGLTRENSVSAGRTESGFSGPIQKTKEIATEEELASLRARASAGQPIPEWALPLVHRVAAAGLPGIRWNLPAAEWLILHSLIQRKGVDAMADYAARAAASASRPVMSARYFLSGWKELPDAPPAGTTPPTLRAIPGGAVSRRQSETDALFDRAMRRAIAREESQ